MLLITAIFHFKTNSHNLNFACAVHPHFGFDNVFTMLSHNVFERVNRSMISVNKFIQLSAS